MTEFEPSSPALVELSARGFVEQLSDGAAIDAALAHGAVTFYVGFDPTAPSLHVGHLVCIMAMRRLQQHGHRPLVIMGGGTARVGDPTGKTEARKLLTPEVIAANRQRVRGQFARFLSLADESAPGLDVRKGLLLDNDDWLSPLSYLDFLRDVGVHFSVNRMLAAKTYRDRLDAEESLSFLEFNYQLLQAYDFLHLYRTHGCTLQLGGADQWGNILAGVELIRRLGLSSLGPAHAATFPLLTTADGKKMGKTERGAVWLDADMLPAADYYQYWVGCDDRDVRKLLLLFTELDTGEIDRLCAVEGAALRDAKARLAFEATALCHGREAANLAETAARQAFGGTEDWSAVTQVHIAAAQIKLVDLVTAPEIAAFPSKRQARERIAAGAVRINGEVCRDPLLELPTDGLGRDLRLEAGKKLRRRVVLAPG